MLKKKFRTLQELENQISKEELVDDETIRSLFIDDDLEFFYVVKIFKDE